MKKLKTSLLLKNTIMLYILQFSTYFLSLVTVPYQTRRLGPEVYGVIGVAIAVMTYFQLFMDFGFLLSATEDISKNRDDADYINRKLTSITVLKTILAVISVVVMTVLCFAVPKFSEHKTLYIIYVLAYAINAFIPDYLYRGIEQMTAITVRTVLIKVFFTAMIFIFLKDASDYLVIPILLLIGNTGAVVGAYLHIFKKLGYRFKKPAEGEIFADFKRSLTFFYSRIATTVYSTTNTVIIGFIDKTGVVTGYYTSADKVLTTAKNGLTPISDSLYPYMIKNKDFKLVKKCLMIFMPIILAGCAFVAVFAKPLCVLAFGKEFEGTAVILRAMLPAIVAILPSYILGFPTLGAMGLSKYANYSVIVGTVTHIIGLVILAFTGNLTVIGLAIMTSVSEWSILICRLVVVFKNRHIFSKSNIEEQ